MKPFKDHFSAAPEEYRRYRPNYPAALFQWLAEQTPQRRLAWDCATGNGQTAIALSAHFEQVVASDASRQQLAAAPAAPGVEYRLADAEASGLADGGIDLICVSQALHWFDIPAFFAEARRVLRPGGVLAIWSYGLLTLTPSIDHLIGRLYNDTLAPYWPPERRQVESGYAGIALPFPELSPPALQMQMQWSLPELCGYLRTWSAVQRCRNATGNDPVTPLQRALGPLWGDPDEPRTVRWPLALRVGRKPDA